MKKYILFLLPLLLIACTGMEEPSIPEHLSNLENLTVSPVVENPDTVVLEREQLFGDTAGVVVSEVRDFAVDEQERVYIADDQQQIIHLFNPDGSHLGSLGGEGSGPGEFRGLSSIEIMEDRLYAYDGALERINTYDLYSYEPLNPIILNPQNREHISEEQTSVNSTFFPVSEDTLLMKFNILGAPDDRTELAYLMNNDGELVSDLILEQTRADIEVLEISGMPFVFPLASRREPLMDVSSTGEIFSGWTEEFLIKVYDLEGKYLRAFYRPYQKSPLNPDDIINTYREGPFRRALREIDFPETWPALNSMFIDDRDRLWVSTIVDDQEVYQWWILDPQGSLLARFRWPQEREIQVVRNGSVYTFERDPETGIERVVRYSMEIQE